MEVQILDESANKKTSQVQSSKVGENYYYSEYNTQIENKLAETGTYTLKQGDIISSVDKDFVKHAENVGKEFDKKRLSQSQTDKALLSLITDLNGVKIETLSVDFLSQKTFARPFIVGIYF